jgi:RecG-like helicase
MVTNAATARKHDSAALPLGRLSVLGIHSAREAVLSLPAHYLDLRSTAIRANFSRLRSGEAAVLRCVGSGRALTHSGPPVRSTFSVWDDHRYAVRVTVFGDARPLLARIKSGQVFHLRGEVTVWDGRLQLSNPQFIDRAWIGRVVPVHSGKPRVISPETASERIAALVDGAAVREAAEWLRERLGWTREDEARRLSALPGKRPAPPWRPCYPKSTARPRRNPASNAETCCVGWRRWTCC